MDSITKKCTKCGVEKTLDKFVYRKSGPLNTSSHCKECRNNKGKEYKKEHADEIKEKNRSEENKKLRRLQYSLNPEKQKERSRDYYNKHTEERKEPAFRKNSVDRVIKYASSLRDKIFDLLGSKCEKCGFSDKRALQIDHINGNGAKEFKELKSRHAVYRRVLKIGKKEYQILCANCNWIKRYENNEVKKR